MNATATASLVAELTHRRREMRRELARVRWWRRITRARKELVVAQLARPDSLAATGLDVTLEALAADAPTSQELASAIWPDATPASAGSLNQLASLERRLESYESRVSETLENVTAQMVKAMSDAQHKGASLNRGSSSTGGNRD